jgi:pimeloyl-ACP methyl ester carboxylesterase
MDRETTITLKGADLFVSVRGSGPPILFLHGNPDSSDIWTDVVAQLRASFRCIAPDLPGFGRSKVSRDFDYSFENLGRFLDEAIAGIGVTEPVHLVAHDFGGAFAMTWAILRPERVRSITVINHPFFVSGYRWHNWARIWRTPPVGELSMLLMNWPLFRRSVRRGSRKLSDEKIRRAYAFVDRDTKRAVLRLYRAADPPSFAEWETRMLATTAAVPTLVLWGEHDPYIPRWVADRFGARQVIVYPESGHWAPAEVPGRVAKDLLDFYGRLPAAH